MDATCKVQDNIHVFRLVHNMCPGFWVHIKLIEESLYLKIKYGTDDIAKIALLNCGISSSLSKLLQEKYSNMFTADINNSSVIFSQNLISEMVKNNENGVLISEVKMNVQE